MPELLTMASCRKDWKRISPESSVMSPQQSNQSRDWTELNFVYTFSCLACQYVCAVVALVISVVSTECCWLPLSAVCSFQASICWGVVLMVQELCAQFSSVQSLDWLGGWWDMTDDQAEILFQSSLQEVVASSSGTVRNVHSFMRSIQHFLCQLHFRHFNSILPLFSIYMYWVLKLSKRHDMVGGGGEGRTPPQQKIPLPPDPFLLLS